MFTLPSHLPSLPTTSTTTNRAPLPFQCAYYWFYLIITILHSNKKIKYEKKLKENHDTAFANPMGRVDVEGEDYICPPLCQVRFHENCVIQKMRLPYNKTRMLLVGKRSPTTGHSWTVFLRPIELFYWQTRREGMSPVPLSRHRLLQVSR